MQLEPTDMRILFTLAMVSFFALPALAEENAKSDMSPVIEMMVLAKATGMCGAFSQMVNFQSTTKMPGGDEFIVRFLNTEAARLGHTLESFMAQCPEFVKRYNESMKLLGYDE